MNSDTPRTDAEWERYAREGHRDAGQHFAANLERELNDTNAVALRYAYEIDRLKEEIEKHALTSSPALAQAQAQIDQLVHANARIVELETELAAAQAKIVNQSERIRYLEGATNHATGTPLSQAHAKIAALEAQLEADAWKISPAMAQAQIDQLNLRIVRLETALQKINELTRDPWSADVAFHAINGTEMRP